MTNSCGCGTLWMCVRWVPHPATSHQLRQFACIAQRFKDQSAGIDHRNRGAGRFIQPAEMASVCGRVQLVGVKPQGLFAAAKLWFSRAAEA